MFLAEESPELADDLRGGDWGAIVTNVMAQQAPQELLGIHTNMPGTAPRRYGEPPSSGLSADERCTDWRPPPSAWLRAHLTHLCGLASLRRPYTGRHPRQHHALLVDEHGDFFGSPLLGMQGRLFQRLQRLRPRCRERLS